MSRAPRIGDRRPARPGHPGRLMFESTLVSKTRAWHGHRADAEIHLPKNAGERLQKAVALDFHRQLPRHERILLIRPESAGVAVDRIDTTEIVVPRHDRRQRLRRLGIGERAPFAVDGHSVSIILPRPEIQPALAITRNKPDASIATTSSSDCQLPGIVDELVPGLRRTDGVEAGLAEIGLVVVEHE